MLEPWNDASLLPPPVHTSPCNENIDIKELIYICNGIIKVLSQQSPLHKESAILSRFLYKFDKKFRNDIGYRRFKTVITALKKYLTLNLLKDVENFTAVLPNDDDLYLPTRQMLEYVLVRLITFSKLMVRISVCSKQAAAFYLDRVKRGESHWMSFMPYALLSRVWSMAMVLLRHSCNWYKKLYPFLDNLTLKGLAFLPADYKLPQDLEEWLKVKDLDDFGRFKWSQKKQVQIDPDLVEDEEGDTFNNILNYVTQINDEIPEDNDESGIFTNNVKNTEELKVKNIKNVDQGEAISRDTFKSFMSVLSRPISTKIDHYVERVTNKDSLQKFIETEDKLRNENNHQALTTHLSFMQWQALKNSLSKLLESLSNNRKIGRKFQKIWKEKCIDCK